MGKTTRWFRSLLGSKKSPTSSAPGAGDGSACRSSKNTKWGLVKSSIGSNPSVLSNGGKSSNSSGDPVDANKHAIAVAAATAAVAEAALAAAQAAAEVVRLTSGGSSRRRTFSTYGGDRRRELAAVAIQSSFRAYLARRALKALKALVRLQALVRGHIVRKQSTNMLQRMQAMVRIQARACAHRAYMSDSPHSSSKSPHSHQFGASPKTFNHQIRAFGTNNNGSTLKRNGSNPSIKDNIGQERSTSIGSHWLDHWVEENSRNRQRDTSIKYVRADDEKSDKILEVDTWNPHPNLKKGDNTFQSSQHVYAWNHNEKISTPFEFLTRNSTKSQRPNQVPSPRDSLKLSSLKFNQEYDQATAWAVENSPVASSASSRQGINSRRGPLTPARSEFSQSFYSNYMGHPNYMANTESSQAKVRSQSAPRQRMDYEKPSSTKRFVRGYWDEETSSEKGWPLHGNLRLRARDYRGSGRSAIAGMPVQVDAMGYNSMYGSGR